MCEKETTVLQIVAAWLKAHGYDGLTDGDDCGCSLEDFVPCGVCLCHCFPAYQRFNEAGIKVLSRQPRVVEESSVVLPPTEMQKAEGGC